jgi:hypothetical protein
LSLLQPCSEPPEDGAAQLGVHSRTELADNFTQLGAESYSGLDVAVSYAAGPDR